MVAASAPSTAMEAANSASVFMPCGENAVPSSLLAPMSRGTLRNSPALSWTEDRLRVKSPSTDGDNA